ncbi:hypothetical protein CcaverHIS002_0408500 [Cutaneotrichosporon cavernicola]|nr:hypothetical protein CcaverHIS002_0408500 [Cutaneotrichosporon cavernicola]BEI99794.1 hypothetical protein CcaverHIS631_0408370 [Cutaneotrichosporon cavernicola]BEJ07570.1 hypothetical protein CcaverHIS641_0408390 [Cutaneotrichosporon cavernicola]
MHVGWDPCRLESRAYLHFLLLSLPQNMFALFYLVSFVLAALALAAPVPHAKRFDGKATYYEAGLGACGGVNTGADKIVALNAQQWDGGAHCGKTITITEGGKSAQATIVDLCPGCPYGALDLSESLFTNFHDTGKGVFQLSWTFNDGSGGGGNSDPKPAPEEPKPTPTPTPEPTPTPAPAPEQPKTTETPSSASETPSSSADSPSVSVSSAPVISSSVLSSILSNSTTVSSTLSTNSTLLASSTANSTALLPTPSTAAPVSAGDAAIINDSPNPEGTLADLGGLVASLGRIVVLGATA